MRVTAENSHKVPDLLVYMPTTTPDPEKPMDKYRLEIIGRLVAADNVEGWVDQQQWDGTMKRLFGSVSFVWNGQHLPAI